MKEEQLSLLEPIKQPTKQIKKHIKDYAFICDSCLCNECRNSGEIYPYLEEEECKSLTEVCFNCDYCYYYGKDNKKLSRGLIKYECSKFQMSNYYSELKAKKRRKKFKILKRGNE